MNHKQAVVLTNPVVRNVMCSMQPIVCSIYRQDNTYSTVITNITLNHSNITLNVLS